MAGTEGLMVGLGNTPPEETEQSCILFPVGMQKNLRDCFLDKEIRIRHLENN